MKNISLADHQLHELIDYYNKEREKAWKRFEETTSVLEKLTSAGKTAVSFSHNGTTSSSDTLTKRGRKPNSDGLLNSTNKESLSSTAKRRGRKPGSTVSKSANSPSNKQKQRKSKWGSFIVSALKSKKQPLQITQIAEIALLKKKYPADDYDKVKAAIAGGLHRLTNVNKRLIPLSVPGERGSFYSLKEWLGTDNRLKDKFNTLPAEAVVNEPETSGVEH